MTGDLEVCAGVDEAGKGPVLGSMFAACVVADPADLPEGVGDSKTISPDRRERLASQIRARAQSVTVSEIPVERIDDPRTDMNTLTIEAHTEALAGIDGGLRAYLDAADTSATRFESRIVDRLSADIDVVAEHGADEQFPIVGAASILAKVERDAHVDRLADAYGEIGSGYPSDESTREFLEKYVTEHGELPECARESWQTSRDIENELAQSGLEDFG